MKDAWTLGYEAGYQDGRAGLDPKGDLEADCYANGYDRGYRDGERARDFAWKQALRETFAEDLRRVRETG